MLLRKVKFYAMRAVSNKTMRDALTNYMASRIGNKISFKGKSELVAPDKDQQHLDNINQHGFTELDHKITNGKLDQIINYAKKLKCFDPFHRDLGEFDIEDVSMETHVANFKREDLLNCKPILELANDPGILRVVQDFLGARPTISNVNMWWSLGGRDKAKDAQLFHRDVDDFKFCKLFIYLTDVSETQGPHTYVKGSSASTKLRKIRRYQDEEIIKAFGKENIIQFIRPKGSVFIVNTYGFHKGLLPTKGDRLLLQIQYSLHPIGIESYQPIKVEDVTSFDKYTNRLLIKS